MRSLFARILLWFLATMAVAIFGIVATTIVMAMGAEEPRPGFLSFQSREAQHVYETGGKEALEALLRRMAERGDAIVAFTDAEGRDLVTGEDRSEWLQLARQHRPGFFGPGPLRLGDRHMLARATPDGRYRLFLLVPPRNVNWWFLRPQYLWILGAIVLLCYLLAFNLTKHLRVLQRTVERFGQGDLSARVDFNRRDEVGDLARSFNQMADRTQTLLSAERRLLLDISHELRSPLARLGVAVELARDGDALARDAALNRIEREASRLNELVGELLQVTRAEGDPSSLPVEPLSLDALLDEILTDCEVEARSRGCSLEVREHGPMEVEGDAELLRRAVENVVRNAIRYTPEQTAVEITLERLNGKAVIRVRDYGPGVPAESLPHLFDPFYRVESDRNRNTGGAGLGLSIARRAVELHHGRIEARNAQPGLQVTIELPVKVAAPVAH
jgi:signal transduction histidine kinase